MNYAKRLLQIDVKVRTSGVCSTIWTKRRSIVDTRGSDLSHVHFSIYHVLYSVHSKWEHLVCLDLYHKLVNSGTRSRVSLLVFCIVSVLLIEIQRNTEIHMVRLVYIKSWSTSGTKSLSDWLFIKKQEIFGDLYWTYLYLKYKYREIQKYKWFASIFIKNCSNCGTRASEYTAD